jgi:alpha-mannosidase
MLPMNFKEVIILIPSHSLEDFPSELSEKPASSLLNVFAVAWHPALLLETQEIPVWRRYDSVLPDQAGSLFLIPTACDDNVTIEWSQSALAAGSAVVRGQTERKEMLAAALSHLDSVPPMDEDLVAVFLAFGTTWLLCELLTRHMRNFSSPDAMRMKTEMLAAARAARDGDVADARRHLGHAFDLLLECREGFYPVQCFLMDLCLGGATADLPSLERLVESKIPSNILMTARDLETIQQQSPSTVDRLREAWQAERTDIVGGDWREGCTQLSGINSVLWSLERGRRGYREQLSKSPTIWGRRRYGVNLAMPQLLQRSGFAGGLHFVMDDGLYPDDEQTRLRWEGHDHSVLESYSRIPLAGDSASSFLRFPVRMAESMDHDHVAAVSFARWPDLRSPWLDDLRRMAKFAPVLGRFVTFAEFFQVTEQRERYTDLKSTDYLTPFLVQAVAREEAQPISRYREAATRRNQFDRGEFCSALASLLRVTPIQRAEALEERVEQEGPDLPTTIDDTLSADLANHESTAARRLAPILVGDPGRKGVLLINTLSYARRVVADWPVGLPLPPVEGSVVAVQPDAQRPAVVVDMPPSGFLWAAGDQPARTSQPAKKREGAWAEGLSLGNEYVDIRLSEATGGMADIRTPNVVGNRLSQQLALRFPSPRTVTVGEGDDAFEETTYYSVTVCDSHRVISEGSTLAEIETVGRILDPQNQTRVLAEFRQRVRLWRGRPAIELEIDVNPIKPIEGDPWTNYIGIRWAWKNEDAAITKGVMQAAQPVLGERIEASDYLEIADDSQRIALLTSGLPFHRLTGTRMLDTLLLVAGETAGPRTMRIAFDQQFPMQAAISSVTPPVVIPVDRGPSSSGASGWLFHVGAKNVMLLKILPLDSVQAGSAAGYVLRLMETEGLAKAFKLYAFRQPSKARLRDFIGQTICPLGIDPDGGVLLEMAAYEACEVELLW